MIRPEEAAMARPVNADSARTRQRVLDAALRLFAARGRRETSVRQVAGSAGVSLAMIHHYFGSKGGLYDACLEASRVDLERGLEGLAPHHLDSPDAVDELVRSTFRALRQRPDSVRLLMRTLVDEGEDPAGWREGVVAPFIERTVDRLGSGPDRGALRLGLQSLLALGMRYVVASPRDLALMTGHLAPGQPEPSPEVAAAALADLERHLVEVGRLLLIQARRLP